MAHEFCPTCKRKMPVPRGTDSNDKKLRQDTLRAMAAIDVLERFEENFDANRRREFWEYSDSLRQSARDECLRLKRAVMNPELLWKIYRRGERNPGSGYAYGLITQQAA